MAGLRIEILEIRQLLISQLRHWDFLRRFWEFHQASVLKFHRLKLLWHTGMHIRLVAMLLNLGVKAITINNPLRCQHCSIQLISIEPIHCSLCQRWCQPVDKAVSETFEGSHVAREIQEVVTAPQIFRIQDADKPLNREVTRKLSQHHCS